MLNWVLEITGTLHPLCKPQHFSLLGARGATRQIIRAGGSATPQHWGKRGISQERKNYGVGGRGGHGQGQCRGSSCSKSVLVCVCVEVDLRVLRQNTRRRVMLGLKLNTTPEMLQCVLFCFVLFNASLILENWDTILRGF